MTGIGMENHMEMEKTGQGDLQVSLPKERLEERTLIESLSLDYATILCADLEADTIQAYRVSERFESAFQMECPVRRFKGFDTDYIQSWVYPADREIVAQTTNPDHLRKKLSENGYYNVIYRIFKDHEPIYIQLRIVNVSSGKDITKVVFGYRNIDSEMMQAIEEKRALEDALSHATMANKAKNVFLSNMSHDIRTPMNAIVGFAVLAQKNLHDRTKVKDCLEMITASSDILLQLLNNILEISRIESKEIQLDERECSLLDILEQVESVVKKRAAAKSVIFFTDVSKLKHDRVFADRQKILQVLLCLTDNAVKYTKEGDRIFVSIIEEETKEGQSAFQFVVEDNGIGISEEFLAHVFEPFEREKNTTLSGIHGSGLGLTIAKKVVETMNGTIGISSKPGVGSKFTVTLTLRLQETQYKNSSHLKHIPEKNRILIVDDNEINLEIGMEILKDAGYLVDSALDGSIALEKIQNAKAGSYAMVLMDIQMPVMNGYEAAKAIRKLENPALANIPIIALSANTFEEDKRLAIKSGMNAHVAKPINTLELYKTMQRILDSGL